MLVTVSPTTTGWSWEVLTVDGRVLAHGVTDTPAEGRHYGVRAYLDALRSSATAGMEHDLARAPSVRFGGRHGTARGSTVHTPA